MKVSVIIACGGSGTRAGMGKNKLLCAYMGKPLLAHALSAFTGLSEVCQIILPCSKNDRAEIESIAKTYMPFSPKPIICSGGATRTQSVLNALKLVEESDYILIHDGARPFLTADDIRNGLQTALRYGSAVFAVPLTDTIAKIDCEDIEDVPDRNGYCALQTPQIFRTEEILSAYAQISSEDAFTDDSAVYARYIGRPRIHRSAHSNRKITFAEDFAPACGISAGCGYDTHAMVVGRKFILGGIEIPYEKGLLGHSDADALTHAVMDAILTACGERDIGVLFPDTDLTYAGADSTLLLKEVFARVAHNGWQIRQISAVIMCQRPKLAEYLPLMSKKLAEILRMDPKTVNFSATTTEKLGFIGREEGVAVHAVVTCANQAIRE